MLDLVRAFHGSPSTAFRLQTLCLPTESLIVSQSFSLSQLPLTQYNLASFIRLPIQLSSSMLPLSASFAP